MQQKTYSQIPRAIIQIMKIRVSEVISFTQQWTESLKNAFPKGNRIINAGKVLSLISIPSSYNFEYIPA